MEIFPLPAVDKHRSLAWLVGGLHPPVEVDHGGGVVWDPMIRPGREVVLGHGNGRMGLGCQLRGVVNM